MFRFPLVAHAFAGVVLTATLSHAQDAGGAANPPPAGSESEFGWKPSANGTLNLSQSYFDNWSKGGTNTMSWEGRLEGAVIRKEVDWDWETRARVAYGQSHLDGLGTRKASDELMFETVYTRNVMEWINPFAAGKLQSQFAAGYDYNDSAGTRTRVTGPFDPTYVTQTVGLGKSWTDAYTVRVGGTLKETFSAAQYGYADDTETAEIETFKIEPGASFIADVRRDLMENILLTSNLNVFVNFRGIEAIDVRWENQLTAKVNSFVSLNAGLEILYDKDISARRQIRQTMAVGVSFLTI